MLETNHLLDTAFSLVTSLIKEKKKTKRSSKEVKDAVYLEETFVPLLYLIIIELCVSTEIFQLLRLQLAVLLPHQFHQ